METNDPHLPSIKLVISGEVREFASILPKYVSLSGRAGIEVGEIVTVRPIHAFRVLGAVARSGANIRVSTHEKIVDGRTVYLITIVNTLKTSGTYTDTVIIRTDSPLKPEISVRVRGEISSGAS